MFYQILEGLDGVQDNADDIFVYGIVREIDENAGKARWSK